MFKPPCYYSENAPCITKHQNVTTGKRGPSSLVTSAVCTQGWRKSTPWNVLEDLDAGSGSADSFFCLGVCTWDSFDKAKNSFKFLEDSCINWMWIKKYICAHTHTHAIYTLQPVAYRQNISLQKDLWPHCHIDVL